MLSKRPLMIFAVVLVLTTATLGCAVQTTTQTGGSGNLHVLIISTDGGVLAGAKVVSDEQPEGQLKVTGITKDDGSVTYNDIKAGKYEFYVSRFDYENKDFSVTVIAGKTTDITVTLTRATYTT
jgi:uncharacterized membrane protein